LVATRQQAHFNDPHDLNVRTQLDQGDYTALAAADALRTLTGNRHRAHWAIDGFEKSTPLFSAARFSEAEPMLRQPSQMESIVSDYASQGLSLRQHPLACLRQHFPEPALRAKDLWALPDSKQVYVIGLVITRQRPGSARNVTFVTLEDETGFINLVIWEKLAERQRKTLLGARILGVKGVTQKQDGVLHVIAHQLEDRTALLTELPVFSRNFR
jgi:error-prone DNA polymerase